MEVRQSERPFLFLKIAFAGWEMVVLGRDRSYSFFTNRSAGEGIAVIRSERTFF